MDEAHHTQTQVSTWALARALAYSYSPDSSTLPADLKDSPSAAYALTGLQFSLGV